MPTNAATIRTVAIVANPEKKLAQQEKPRLVSWLSKHRITIVAAESLDRADAVLTLGGDGTILSIAPQAAQANIPVLGINTGRLGFMTAVELKQMYRTLPAWLAGRWHVSVRMMLDVFTPNGKKPLLALNDAVIRTGSTTRVTRIGAFIDQDELGHFVGDGVIVATSTGSTAYSLSAHGPVVHPAVDAMILTPICAHSFSQRPIVFPSHQQLSLRVDDPRADAVQLSLDGQRVFRLKSGDLVRIRRSQYKLQLLHDPKRSYYGVLKEKLSWGERG